MQHNRLWFDESFLHEDEGFTAILFCLAQRAISSERRLFKRRVRANSIMTTEKTLANVEGLIQSAVKIESFKLTTQILDLSKYKALSLKKRQLLRNSMKVAEAINELVNFRLILTEKFTFWQLLRLDSAMFFYCKMPIIFMFLRTLKRKL